MTSDALPASPRLLLVEDNQGDAELVEERLATLTDSSFELIRADSLRAARERLAEQSFDGVLLDLNLGDSQGVETLRSLDHGTAGVPVVVLSSGVTERVRAEALAAGALLVLDKDEPPERHLPRSVQLALERHRAGQHERQIERLVAEAPTGILVVDLEGVVRLVNDAALGLFGRLREDFEGELLGFSVPEAELSEIEVVRQGETRIAEIRVVSFEWKGAPALLVSIRDVTDAKQAVELRARLSHVVSSSPSVLYSLAVGDDGFRLAWISDNLLRLTGYTEHEALQPDWWRDRLHPDDRERVLAQTPEILASGTLTKEYRIQVRDGSYRWIHDEQRLATAADGASREVVGSWTDVTRRKAVELERREQEEQYRLLFESNPQPMWVVDAESLAMVAVNAAAVEHYGWPRERFLQMTLSDLVVPDQRATLRQALDSPPATWSFRHLTSGGAVIEVETTSSPIAFRGRRARLVLARDVTERRSLQAQLVQAQKMESIGRLAGGVAHDFNNILGVITGYGELLRGRAGSDPRLVGYSEEILKASQRAAVLTRQLLAFSRRQVLQPIIVDVNEVVAEMKGMLARLIGEDVRLTTALGVGVPAIQADVGQLEQVLMNLVVNARDAMPRGGRLAIETSSVVLDDAYAAQHPGVAPGRFVVLAVSDSGTGMDAATLEKIFEPFYTTKEQGRGTGLGLATVHGIVKQSGGHIYPYSEPGKGSTFKIYLPAHRAAAGQAEEESAETEPSRGTETVLVVEDEEALCNIVRAGLEAAGYTVLQASRAAAARRLAAGHQGPIQLLLTDVVMPDGGGRDLAIELRARRPEMKVLFMSGYTDDAVVMHGVLERRVPFLQKPFTLADLARKVREVLDRPAAAPK